MSGLPWFELDVDFHDHPKTVALEVALKNPLAEAYVSRIWAYCYKHATDRFVGLAAAATLEQAARWKGKTGHLARILLDVGFLEHGEGETLVAHGVAERLGPHLDKRARDAQRMRDRRAKFERGRENVARTSPEPSRERRSDVAGERYREREKEKNPKAAAAAAAASDSSSVAEDGGDAPPRSEPAPSAPEAPRRVAPPDDDVPQRPLVVVDTTAGLAPVTLRWPLCRAFQHAIAAGMARTAPFSASALTVPDWDELEALLVGLGLDAAVTFCLDRARAKKPGKPIGGLGWFLVVLRDARPVPRPAEEAAPRRESIDDAIARETQRCPDWGALLARLAADPDWLKPDVVERVFAPLSGSRMNGTLTLAAPTAKHAALLVEEYVERIVERFAPPFKVRVVGPEAASAAGGEP